MDTVSTDQRADRGAALQRDVTRKPDIYDLGQGASATVDERMPQESGEEAVQIVLTKSVASRPLAVFKVVADITSWPQIIGGVQSIELLTPGPIRVGTRFSQTRIMFGQRTTNEMTVTILERPRRLRLISEDRHIPYELDHVIDAVHMAGTRLTLIFGARPEVEARRTILSFVTPVIETTLRGELERDLNDLAAAVPPDA